MKRKVVLIGVGVVILIVGTLLLLRYFEVLNLPGLTVIPSGKSISGGGFG